MELTHFTKICDAIVALMNPLVEVVIHDLTTNTIAYKNGSLSQRVVGEPSLLDIKAIDIATPLTYSKINFDGRLVKSISIQLHAQYILCINCDISIFTTINTLTATLIEKNLTKQPQALFSHDWQETLHTAIHTYLNQHKLTYDHLSLTDKKKLALYLFDQGAFNEKRAHDYIAKIINISRSTLFKYIKEWKKNL